MRTIKLQGKNLDARIEQELQLMLLEGLEDSPISNKNLHTRLIEKNVITGKLSTLSKRKKLIDRYKQQQIEDANLSPEAEFKLKNNRTVEGYRQKCKDKAAEVKSLEEKLAKNTEVLINIIKEVESNTTIKVEHLLSKYLLEAKIESDNK